MSSQQPHRQPLQDEMCTVTDDGELWIRFLDRETIRLTIHTPGEQATMTVQDADLLLRELGRVSEAWLNIIDSIERGQRERSPVGEPAQ